MVLDRLEKDCATRKGRERMWLLRCKLVTKGTNSTGHNTTNSTDRGDSLLERKSFINKHTLAVYDLRHLNLAPCTDAHPGTEKIEQFLVL